MEMASCSSSSSGKPLNGQAREMVYNVATYLAKQKEQYKLKYNVVDSTHDATGISKTFIKRILKDGKESKARGTLKFSISTCKKAPHCKKIYVDVFTKCIIRRKIHKFYIVKKTVPKIKKLNAVLKDKNVLDCSHEYLRKLLKQMGYKWAKCQSSRKILIEKQKL